MEYVILTSNAPLGISSWERTVVLPYDDKLPQSAGGGYVNGKWIERLWDDQIVIDMGTYQADPADVLKVHEMISDGAWDAEIIIDALEAGVLYGDPNEWPTMLEDVYEGQWSDLDDFAHDQLWSTSEVYRDAVNAQGFMTSIDTIAWQCDFYRSDNGHVFRSV